MSLRNKIREELLQERKWCSNRKLGTSCDGGDGHGNGTWTNTANGCQCSYGGQTMDWKVAPPTGGGGRDTKGIYMGAPKGVEPIKRKKRKKEQTTAGASGAYSTSLSAAPIKRKFFQEGIKETELISLIEKCIYSARYGGVIEEALTDSDEKRIGVLARKELKDYETKLEKKIDTMINKSFKGKSFEDATVKIARNAIVQLYKALWIRRSFWTNYISNTSS
tara:strand:- start:799 stop:1461 length:663 start_codon:yes stop_codon:yes gene_type:complete